MSRPDIPRGLVNSILSNEAVLWVGSGLSAMAGLPLWDQTRDLLIDEIAMAGTRTADELEMYRNWKPRDAGSILLNDRNLPAVQRARFFLRIFCKETLTRSHLALRDLGIRQVVTTNWDTLLEAAMDTILHTPPPDLPWQRRCFASFTWRDDIHLAAAERGDLAAWIFHIHGTFYRYDTIIWKQNDYDEIENSPAIKSFLAHLLQHRALLFIGFGMHDEDLDRALRSARFQRAATRRLHYAVLPETHESLEALQENNIVPIVYRVDTTSPEPHRKGLEDVLVMLADDVTRARSA